MSAYDNPWQAGSSSDNKAQGGYAQPGGFSQTPGSDAFIDTTGTYPTPRKRATTPLVVGAVAIAALVGGVLWFVSRDDGPSTASGRSTGLRGVRSEPKAFGEELSFDGSANVMGALGDLLIVSTDTDGDFYYDEINAFDLTTGDEQWSESGTGAVVLDGKIFIADDGDIQAFDAQGKAVGDSTRFDSSEVYSVGPYLRGFDSGDSPTFSLIDPTTLDSVDDLGSMSSNLRFGVQFDYNDSEISVDVVRLPSGERVGSSFDVDNSDFEANIEALDNGNVVALEDGELVLYDPNGKELASQRASDAYYLSTIGDYVVVADDDRATVYSATGNELVELDDPVRLSGGYPWTRLTMDGPLVGSSDEDEQTVYAIRGGSLEKLFKEDGSYPASADGVLYFRSGSKVSAWSTAGGDNELWTLRIGNDGYTVPLDGGLAAVEYDSDNDESNIVVYR